MTKSLQASFDLRAAVEVIAHRVYDDVEAQNRQQHGQRGKQDEMRSVEQVGAAIVEHGSPTGGRRRDAESEKTHGGFGENGSGHADRSLHHNGLNNVRQNVADDDAQVAGAKGARGFDEFAFAGGEHLSANQTRVADPSAQREREHQIKNPRAAEGDERDGQQNSW